MKQIHNRLLRKIVRSQNRVEYVGSTSNDAIVRLTYYSKAIKRNYQKTASLTPVFWPGQARGRPGPCTSPVRSSVNFTLRQIATYCAYLNCPQLRLLFIKIIAERKNERSESTK